MILYVGYQHQRHNLHRKNIYIYIYNLEGYYDMILYIGYQHQRHNLQNSKPQKCQHSSKKKKSKEQNFQQKQNKQNQHLCVISACRLFFFSKKIQRKKFPTETEQTKSARMRHLRLLQPVGCFFFEKKRKKINRRAATCGRDL